MTEQRQQPSTDMARQLFTQYLPKKVDELSNDLQKIQDRGWNQDSALKLNQHLQHLNMMTKEFSYHPIESLISKLIKSVWPFLQPQSPIPTPFKLQELRNDVKKLQEVIAINAIDEQDIAWEKPETIRHTLLIGLTDKQLATEISHQVNYFGYSCIFSTSFENLLELAQTPESADKIGVIIIDTEYCPGRKHGMLKTISEKIPIIFISAHQDVATRLFAVNAGGQAYFVRPIEYMSLIERIDQIVMPVGESSPYRILIIEDSRTQANIIRKHLEQAGMIAETLMDPLKLNETLIEFQPELILLDLYMPICSGIDLAKVIRQQDPFVSIPIVYLSAEDNTKRQLYAMRRGGDDFLTKGITPEHLIDVVTTRVERSRILRSEMILDSLTGLINHTRILEQLDLEIARAKRYQIPLSFAMIDIDYFKTVNDVHGHLIGDKVIKGLARFLKQRLRKVDSVGRYGGEEFAVIFPQSKGQIVYKVLDEIRCAFSKLLHQSQIPSIEFSATFSAGLAEINEEIDSVDKLIHAADKALYTAKKQGRNCIVMYQPSQT